MAKMTHQPFKLLQWNARSLYKSKLVEFKQQLRDLNPHVVLLSETHWKDEYIPKFSAYTPIVLNRSGQGGGVAILAKKS